MRTTGLLVCFAVVLAACSFDQAGVDYDDLDDNAPTASPPNFDDRVPVGDFPDGGVIASTCLIISEYIEGQGNNNKAIELYNCGGDTLNMSEFGVCLVRNSDTECGSTFKFSGTLEPGAVLTVCRTTEGTDLDPIDTIRDNCQVVAGAAMNFNGDDRLVVFRDTDANEQLSASDEVMDALGRIASQPLEPVWSELTLRRCNFTPADGQTEFVHTDYFTEHPRHDATNFGVAPTEGC